MALRVCTEAKVLVIDWNIEGELLLEFAEARCLTVVNTCFEKENARKVTCFWRK